MQAAGEARVRPLLGKRAGGPGRTGWQGDPRQGDLSPQASVWCVSDLTAAVLVPGCP